MKENVLDVLMYLFHSYMEDKADPDPDRESMQSDLLAAGFHSRQVRQAFEWIDSLAEQPTIARPVNPRSHRIYVGSELVKLDSECRGFLLFLEQSGILDTETRERVIDRVMALEADDVGLAQLKWITLMVLFNQPGQEQAYVWLEHMVFDGIPDYLH